MKRQYGPILLGLLVLSAAAGAAQTLVPLADSRLWLEGRSNINRFSCAARQYQLQARLQSPPIGDIAEAPTADGLFLALDIPVNDIRCGKDRMDRDLKNALKAERHAYIRFVLRDARLLSAPTAERPSYHLQVQGDLTVAGVTRPISFEADGYRLADGRLQAVGQAAIQMTDYGVKPPTGLWGLIRAHDRLDVHFDLVVEAVEDRRPAR